MRSIGRLPPGDLIYIKCRGASKRRRMLRVERDAALGGGDAWKMRNGGTRRHAFFGTIAGC
jgi:hypothetical protein